jgi:O-antigen ligase
LPNSSANSFAYFALIAAPLAVLVFYRRFSPAVACAGAVVGGVMFLPQSTSFKLPGIPELDKEALIFVAVFVASRLFSAPRWRAMKLEPMARLLILGLLGGSVCTVFLNRDAFSYGPTKIAPHVPYDAISAVMLNLFVYVIPFSIGRAIYRTPEDLRSLMKVLAGAGLVYSVPALFEVRFSPQLHSWIYGFAQNEFGKNLRWGGYRPVLFMQSGIAVGVYMATTALAAAALQKARIKVVRFGSALISLFLIGMVILCKSTAAIIYTLVFAPLFRFAPQGLVRVTLRLLLVVVLSYPVLRMAGSGPTDALLDVAAMISEERAASLEFRFNNESAAMDHIQERLYFGWGGYARNRVYSPEGQMMSTFDAFYIIITSQAGIVGAFCVFGLLAYPIFRLLRQSRRIASPQLQALAFGLGYILLVRLLDLMQNGFYSSLPMLLSGALLGVLPSLTQTQQRARARDAGRARSRQDPPRVVEEAPGAAGA